MEIADTVLERLCLSLIIPVVRPNSIKVFSYILCSAQSKTVFFKILPRIFKVFQNIQKDYSKDAPIPPDVQLFIDLMVAFVRRYDLDHSELVRDISLHKSKRVELRLKTITYFNCRLLY